MLTQSTSEFGLMSDQGASHAKTDGSALSIHSAAIGRDNDVPLVAGAGDGEGLFGDHFANRIGEILGESAAIDGALAGARTNDDAGNGGLATASCLNLVGINGLGSDEMPPRCL